MEFINVWIGFKGVELLGVVDEDFTRKFDEVRTGWLLRIWTIHERVQEEEILK